VSRLIYLRPVNDEGEEVWCSEANIAFWQSWLTRDAFSDVIKAQIRTGLGRMRAHLSQFVEMFPAADHRQDTIFRLPRRVAVLVDRGCASSCEDFVLEARQSHKVVVVGAENTAGVHDYGNLRKVYLPGWRQMMVPTSRARGPQFDFIGLAPEVRIPKGTADLVDYAWRYLQSVDSVRH